MTQMHPSVNYTPCQIRQVDFVLVTAPCDRCGQDAGRADIAQRTAIDIDLDQPTLLAVRVSVHYCPPCHHYFRAQPPFLRRDAIFTRRVVRKAVEAVYADGLAFRTVGQRLARDFWVQPSEAIIRRWCRAYHDALTLDEAYQEWIVADFSGILCVDELYQHDLALLLAVDPAAPDGDRVVGYQLVHEGVDAAAVTQFLTRLARAGIQPDEVITDGSPLYPGVLATVWPQAAHQLCLFHETRRLTRAAQAVIRQVRRTLPPPPPVVPGRGGRLGVHPPSDDPDDPALHRWHARHATHRAGVAHVHALARQGHSQRAIARHLGLNRRTVHAWLSQEHPAAADMHAVAPVGPPSRRPYHRRTPALVAQIRDLAAQGLSPAQIARRTDVHRSTISIWLRQEEGAEGTAACPPTSLRIATEEVTRRGTADKRAGLPAALPVVATPVPDSLAPEPPPAPWTDWNEVRALREALRDQRGLLLRRPEHLTTAQHAAVAALLASPVGPTLSVARDALTDWYALFRDETGRKRSPHEAQARYTAWRQEERYATLAPLARALAQITPARFDHLSQFLRHPAWEATNNGAERAGRAFRHGQGPHFNLRSRGSIEGALKARLQHRRAAASAPPPPVALCSRGRRSYRPREECMAA